MTSRTKEILEALEALSERYPEMRFGQMVANVAQWAVGPSRSAVWGVEDEAFLEAIERQLQTDRQEKRLTSAGSQGG